MKNRRLKIPVAFHRGPNDYHLSKKLRTPIDLTEKYVQQ